MYSLQEIFEWIWTVELGKVDSRTESKPVEDLTDELENMEDF